MVREGSSRGDADAGEDAGRGRVDADVAVHPAVVERLQLDAKNISGETPYDIARRWERDEEVLSLLK